MFITQKRHEREKEELIRASNRLTDAILKTSSLGLFLLDTNGKILPQVSSHLGALFRRQDFANLNFEKLIGPLVSAKTLSVEANPLEDVELRLPKPDGTHESAHYCFEFTAAETANEPRLWIVRVADVTAREQQQRELVDLRVQVRTQG